MFMKFHLKKSFGMELGERPYASTTPICETSIAKQKKYLDFLLFFHDIRQCLELQVSFSSE